MAKRINESYEDSYIEYGVEDNYKGIVRYFDSKEQAIRYAEDNDYDSVVEIYWENGDNDLTTVWKRKKNKRNKKESTESKRVKESVDFDETELDKIRDELSSILEEVGESKEALMDIFRYMENNRSKLDVYVYDKCNDIFVSIDNIQDWARSSGKTIMKYLKNG